MFGFGKRTNGPAAVSPKCHVILLAGDEVCLSEILKEYILSGQDFTRTAVSLDKDGRGGMVVTLDDPSHLKARYHSMGIKICTVTIPALRKNPHVIVQDLQFSGEYEDWRREYLPG